jgi:TPP-dependent pyruvate/acetoin dehydrogenase alpha subunit
MPQTEQTASPQRVLDHYATMCRIRAFERMVIRGDQEGLVKGAAHVSIGQEGVASGVCGNLRVSDQIASNHRGHGHTIAKGADPEAMMRELFGREGGICGGKGGSMHIADFDVGMLGANGIVGAGILIAVGAAKSKKMLATSDIVVCFFGDGAVNRGPFLEGLNWARVFDLPVLFVCEDNKYAATTRTDQLTGGPGPGARAESLGIPAHKADGNDVIGLDALVGGLVEEIRNGAGPMFVHAETYRHIGHTLADPATYRPEAEVAEAKTRDPIERSRVFLADNGIAPGDLEKIANDAEAEMTAAFEAARDAPWPDLSAAQSDVQDIGGPGLGGPQ